MEQTGTTRGLPPMDEHRCREDREHRGDLLLSTLANYLRAAGATDPRTVVTAGGHDVEPLPMQRPSR